MHRAVGKFVEATYIVVITDGFELTRVMWESADELDLPNSALDNHRHFKDCYDYSRLLNTYHLPYVAVILIPPPHITGYFVLWLPPLPPVVHT